MSDHSVYVGFFLSAALGWFIGWITNWLAIKALFHPQEPVSFLFFEFQGLLPKRQKELAQNLGKIVEGELINIDDMLKKLSPEDIDPIIDEQMRQNRLELEEKARETVRGFVSKIPFVSINPDTIVTPLMNKIEKEMAKTIKKQVPGLLDKAAHRASEKISVKEIVAEKVSIMDLCKLEGIVNKIADKEMKMIIRLGGVLGMVVGVIHWLIQYSFLS
jgi:uncharacterized membrane protein YheB (UPF0754 family)